MRVAVLVALALAGCDGAPAGSRAAGEGRTWHVDHAAGSDSADGRTPATAWKHAPGDAQAGGRAAGVELAPGDVVLFRAGVPYRGEIRLPASGTAAAPIRYSGAGFGAGMGIIDGSDAVSAVRPCASAEDCGGAPDWKALHVITHAPVGTSRIALFGKSGLYWMSQVPALPDPFFADDRRNFAVVPEGQADELKRGELRVPELAAAARGGGGPLEVAIWVRPNRVERRPVLGVAGDVLRFDPEGLDFYADRDSGAALNGSFAGLGAPGTFAPLGPGVILARLRPGDDVTNLSVGSGRNGIELNGQSFVHVTGLDFRNFASSRGGGRQGRAVTSFGPNAHDIAVVGNRFGPALTEAGAGIVHLYGTKRFRFAANRVENIAFGAGFRASGGRPGELLIEGNVFRRVGRTGIGVLGVDGAVIRGNVLTDIRGVHGNGITAYLGNRDIVIEGNCVWASSRPLTFHGEGEPETPNRIRIRGNILVSSPEGQSAISSWGRQTQDVVIEGNVLAGPKMGLLLNQKDRNVRVVGNDTSGIGRRGEVPGDWTIEDNGEALGLEAAMAGRFGEEGCEVPASRLKLVVARSPR